MILSLAIVSKTGEIFYPYELPDEVRGCISKHAKDFLYALKIQNGDLELPYIETSALRYVFKETEDLYWLLVTKLESDMFSDIKILGNFVCTIMEYGSSETNSDTLTDEQRELFYRHLWRPWDDDFDCQCQCQSSNVVDIQSRLQFLIDMRNGNVDEEDVIYFNKLMKECWSINIELSRWDSYGKHDSPDSFETSDYVSEESVIEGCRLKCRFEDLKIEMNRIQDPYLRLFARRDLLIGTSHDQNDQYLSAPSFRELDSKCELSPMNSTMNS